MYRTAFLLTGTTVLGAFDPLEKIADLCEKHKIWMHVDAAWGGKMKLTMHHEKILRKISFIRKIGGALMSQKYKKLLKGIER